MMQRDDGVRLVALYFPQLHSIPENDTWWGKGFTDWHNVRKAQPLFRDHYQPRIPQALRYYDQSDVATLAWQQDIAKRHGVGGFCHYHYWFDGKQLLEKPTNLMLEDKSLDLPFCLAWANETWSRRWDGRDHHILQEQTHKPDPAIWMLHFEYLFRCWSDDRSIKVDGKPIFLVYRAHRINDIDRMFTMWREEALRRGLPGLYLVCMKQYEFPLPEVLAHFDAVMQFQPFEAIYSPDFEQLSAGSPGAIAKGRARALATARLLPEKAQDMLRTLRYRFFSGLTFYDYECVWKQILKVEREAGLPCFPGAFVDWDNTARYVKRARIFEGASPERFAYWFRKLVEVTAQRPPNERFIFLNAWNEWAEGCYLEPDQRYGIRYLEAVRDALAQKPASERLVAS